MDVNLFFKMFANCIITRGKNRSIILDLQREKFLEIPDTMQEVIEEFESKKNIGEIYNLYGIENRAIIDEYLNFLIDNEFGFITDFDEFDLFIKMDNSFEIPSCISNCIIEISNKTIDKFESSMKSLEKLFCKNIQLVCYEEINLEKLKRILEITKSFNFSTELILKYSDQVFNFIPEINKYNFQITKLTLHSALRKYTKIEISTFDVDFIDYELKSFKSCGVIDAKYFNVNKNKVLESMNYNSCLNKKISIDKDGNIKNCPSMIESFGNIQETTLEEALNQPNFKKYWNINKDQIDICKDCEFRHICTDCRAYIESPEDKYSKPLKCGYNPYINEWEDWSTNPLKQKTIEYYGMQDLVKKDA
ncbi:MAG: grasp-with-spasm system SPASM domain peptide maturase [Flavobacterium sp.]|uniref:grasp-with-spasm system SPASM domain peptide maturase n=1 Tax=Flavobacterium sp. TaxID=239 RepID=UPI0032644BBA